MKKNVKRSAMSNNDFVTLWESSPDVVTIGKKYDLGLVSAQQRAMRLRRLGVKLKKFHRAGHVVDVDALNAIVKKSQGQTKA